MPLSTGSMKMYSFAVDPTVNDDNTVGFEVGNFYTNTTTDELFICLDASTGAAVWVCKPTESSSTFTPTLSFGGASVGIVYAFRSGDIIRVGNFIFVTIFIILSNKGSSTGDVLLGGLPTANGLINHAMIFSPHLIINSTNYTAFSARIAPSQSDIILIEDGSNQPFKILTDASFNNNSQISVSGYYFI